MLDVMHQLNQVILGDWSISNLNHGKLENRRSGQEEGNASLGDVVAADFPEHLPRRQSPHSVRTEQLGLWIKPTVRCATLHTVKERSEAVSREKTVDLLR